jgi:CRISPR type I-E-associated protein CasB/Cse2
MSDTTNTEVWLLPASRIVVEIIDDIQDKEAHDSREYRGPLAKARRLFGKLPESDPSATAEVLRLLSSRGFALREATGSDDGLTLTERAAITAIALYAGSPRNAHQSGVSLGAALAKMAVDNEAHKGTAFKSMTDPFIRELLSSDDYAYVVHSLSRILGRLEAHSLDYGLLTNDLIDFQYEDRIEKVKIRWSKDYYSYFNA